MGKLILIVLLVVYVGGIWKFWQGFNRTNYARTLSNRVALALLWPALMVNKTYRRNFQKALKG